MYVNVFGSEPPLACCGHVRGTASTVLLLVPASSISVLSHGPRTTQVQLTLEDRIDRRPTGSISFHVHVTPSAVAGWFISLTCMSLPRFLVVAVSAHG